jgi:hypothetical protein
MELMSDRVPSVRLSANLLLPAMKGALFLPDDVELLSRLNAALAAFQTDADKHVVQAAARASDDFMRASVTFSGCLSCAYA